VITLFSGMLFWGQGKVTLGLIIIDSIDSNLRFSIIDESGSRNINIDESGRNSINIDEGVI